MREYYLLLPLSNGHHALFATWTAEIAAIYEARGYQRVDKATYDEAVAVSVPWWRGLSEAKVREALAKGMREALAQRRAA